MGTPAQIATLVFVLLGILGFIRWWRMGFRRTKYPVWGFVLTVVGVWVIILAIALFTGGQAEFTQFFATAKAYLIGMAVMYIAMKATKS